MQPLNLDLIKLVIVMGYSSLNKHFVTHLSLNLWRSGATAPRQSASFNSLIFSHMTLTNQKFSKFEERFYLSHAHSVCAVKCRIAYQAVLNR